MEENSGRCSQVTLTSCRMNYGELQSVDFDSVFDFNVILVNSTGYILHQFHWIIDPRECRKSLCHTIMVGNRYIVLGVCLSDHITVCLSTLKCFNLNLDLFNNLLCPYPTLNLSSGMEKA